MQHVFEGITDYVLARDRLNVLLWTGRTGRLHDAEGVVDLSEAVGAIAWRFVWKEQYEKSQNDEEENS